MIRIKSVLISQLRTTELKGESVLVILLLGFVPKAVE